MARTNNLTNFLTDVALAIKTKKDIDPSDPTKNITAADFDTEILSIQGGGDTSDATATANDILSPKTAYISTGKVTGGIQIETDSAEKTVTITKTNEIINDALDINVKYNLIVTGPIKTTGDVTIKEFEEDTIGETLITIPASTYGNRIVTSARFSKDVNSLGKLNLYILTGPSSKFYYLTVVQYDVENHTISEATTSNQDLYTWNNRTCSGTVNPVYPDIFAMGGQGSGPHSEPCVAMGVLKYDCEAKTISTLSWDVYYNVGNQPYEVEWSSNGQYVELFVYKGSTGNGFISQFSYATNSVTRILTFPSGGSQYNCMWNGLYFFYDNTLRDMSNNVIKTFSEIPTNCYKWVYNNVLFLWQSSTITIYKIDTVALTLTLVTTVNVGIGKDSNYVGTIQRAYSNDNIYFCNSDGELYKINITPGNSIIEMTRAGRTYYYINPNIATTQDKVLTGNIYYNYQGAQPGTMPNNGALNYTPSTVQQTIPAGYTSGGIVEVAQIANSDEYDACLDIVDEILE